MKWTPEPFKHTASVTVTRDLSTSVSADITVDDIAVEEAAGVVEYLNAGLEELATRLKPKRRTHRKKKQPDPTPSAAGSP